MATYVLDPTPLVGQPIALDRGFFGSGGKLDVMSGTVGIILVGGRYQETLLPGLHQLAKYDKRSNVYLQTVQTKDRTIKYESRGEMFITETGTDGTRAAVKVNLELAVGYRVDPEQAPLVVNISDPEALLFTYVNDAVRESVQFLDFDSFRMGGRGLARLVQFDLEKQDVLGHTRLFVTRVTAGALTGADRVSQQLLDQVLSSRIKPIDPERAILTDPRRFDDWVKHERDKDLMKLAHEQKLREMYLEKFGDPGAFLNQPTIIDVNSQSRMKPPQVASREDNSPRPPSGNSDPPSPEERQRSVSSETIVREWEALQKVADRVNGEPGKRGTRGVPDGSYDFAVTLHDQSGRVVMVYLHLPPDYERGAVPGIRVLRDNQDEQWPQHSAEGWHSDPRLTRLVAEVKDQYS